MFTSIDRLSPICLGHELDNETAVVCVDCTAWIVAYPQLTDYRIEVVRPDGAAYVAANVTLENNTLTWEITDADTAVGGNGSYQIVATGENGERKTSNSAKLFVLDNLPEMTGGEPPEPERPWYEAAMEAAQRAEAAAGKTSEQIGEAIDEYLAENPLVMFETDNTLDFHNNILRVNTTNEVEEDNTLPVTSSAVHTTVGNINALLETI